MHKQKQSTQGKIENFSATSKPLSVCHLKSGTVRDNQPKAVQNASQNSAPKSQAECEESKLSLLHNTRKTSKPSSHSHSTTRTSNSSKSNNETPLRGVYGTGTGSLSVPSQSKPKISSAKISEQSTQSDRSLPKREMKKSKGPDTKDLCDSAYQDSSDKPLKVVTLLEKNNRPQTNSR